MTTKLNAEQRRILQRMAAGQQLLRWKAWFGKARKPAYLLANGGERGYPTGQSVNGLIKRGLIVLGPYGYVLSPAGREAAK